MWRSTVSSSYWQVPERPGQKANCGAYYHIPNCILAARLTVAPLSTSHPDSYPISFSSPGASLSLPPASNSYKNLPFHPWALLLLLASLLVCLPSLLSLSSCPVSFHGSIQPEHFQMPLPRIYSKTLLVNCILERSCPPFSYVMSFTCLYYAVNSFMGFPT